MHGNLAFIQTGRAAPTARVLPSRSDAPRASSKPAPSLPPYQWLETQKVETQNWIDIPDNPRQRNVEERISKGRAKHLMKFDQIHTKVVVGILPDGRMFKADGHTRAHVWASGLVPPPEFVVVEVWRCANEDGVKALYDKFGNKVEMEEGPDSVTGAAREYGVAFESPMMRSGEISTAVRNLFYYITRTRSKRGDRHEVINGAIRLFSLQLKELDKCGPVRAKFPPSVVMAAILTIKAEKTEALAFWGAYAQGLGSKVNGNRDAVVCFEDRLRAILKKRSATKEREVMQEAVAAIRAYSAGKVYRESRGYTSLDAEALREYAKQAFGGI